MAEATSTRGFRIAIAGYGRHGKDEAGQILGRISSLRYGGSTSWAALPFVARELGIAPQVAWETRYQYREFWKSYCNFLRRNDSCFLTRLVLENADIVCGFRGRPELDALRSSKLVDRIVWIDASRRINSEPDPTVDFGPEDCDEILDNNGTLEQLQKTVWDFAVRVGVTDPTVPDYDTARRILGAPLAPTVWVPPWERLVPVIFRKEKE